MHPRKVRGVQGTRNSCWAKWRRAVLRRVTVARSKTLWLWILRVLSRPSVRKLLGCCYRGWILEGMQRTAHDPRQMALRHCNSVPQCDTVACPGRPRANLHPAALVMTRATRWVRLAAFVVRAISLLGLLLAVESARSPTIYRQGAGHPRRGSEVCPIHRLRRPTASRSSSLQQVRWNVGPACRQPRCHGVLEAARGPSLAVDQSRAADPPLLQATCLVRP